MSQAFVKEPDGDETAGELADLPISPHPNHVTPEGLDQLRQRLQGLEAEEAALHGEEGALVARPHLAHLGREIRYFKARVSSAIVVDPAGLPSDRVDFGAMVRAEDDTGKAYDFQIVGEDEADPSNGKVSWISPLARAAKGAAAGDLITWRRPKGDKELEILAISYPKH